MVGICPSGSSGGLPTFAPEFALSVLATSTHLELDSQTAMRSIRADGGRTPLGEVTNIHGFDEVDLRPTMKPPIVTFGDPPVGEKACHDGTLGNTPDDDGEEIRDGEYPIAISSPKSTLPLFTSITSIGRLAPFPSIGSPPTSPALSNPNSASEPSRLSCGSSVNRVSYGSSSVVSWGGSSPDMNMSRQMSSPGPGGVPSPGPNYEIEEQIGEGGYGTVHRVRDLRTDRLHAMKISKKKSTAFREIQLMQAVSNPHVISCYEVVNERNVVMDLMDYDLKKVIEDRSTVLAEVHVKAIAVQIMKGVAAIHQQGFMHRDITPANVLVNSSTGVVKLSDFGIARTLGCGGRRMTPVCTIHAYRSPEGLHGARSYTQAVDVWSVGCVIAEMFKRKELFPGRSDFDMLERVLRSLSNPTAKTFERLWLARAKKTSWADVCGSSWMVRCGESHEGSGAMAQLVPSASPIAHRFLHRLLQLHPGRRPSADQALSDQFFDAVQLGAFDPSSLPFVRRVAERLQF